MKILVLDDDDVRHEAFRFKFHKHDLHQVYTVDGAITALIADGPFDAVFLDHDLNDHQYRSLMGSTSMGKVELNGCDVASFIANVLEKAKRPRTAIVHSWNPAGGKRMVEILREAGIETYRWEFRTTFEGVEFVL